MSLILVGVVIGLVVGVPFGRWRAERGRARFDMRKTWDARKAYRAKKA